MTDAQRSAAFPVHIELGKKETNLPVSPSGKKGKPKMYYPTTYIENVPGLENLPEEGCMLVHYRRTRLTIETPEDGKDSAGATLELRRLCLEKDMGAEYDGEDEPKDLASAMDGKMAMDNETDEPADDENDEGE